MVDAVQVVGSVLVADLALFYALWFVAGRFFASFVAFGLPLLAILGPVDLLCRAARRVGRR